MALEQAVAYAKKANVGSIGSVGLHYDEHNRRIKGIYGKLICKKVDLEELFLKVADFESKNPSATRTTVRAFVRKGLIDGISKVAKFEVEAKMPADRAIKGFDLVYFGANKPERMPDAETTKNEIENIRYVLSSVSPIPQQKAFERVESCGYRICFSAQGKEDIRTLLNLYSEAYAKYTFEINEDTINYMLSNGNRVVLARNVEGKIVSVLIAEGCSFEIDGRLVRLFELSDFATFKAERGKGLITALQIAAINLIRSIYPEALIYAEDRAPWLPVLKSSREAGMEYAGRLPFHCVLVSDRNFNYQQNYEYESLQVFYAK
ncbi:MAG: hypothetical protein QXT25_01660 [Candidatus Anstonellaceae archaeon]